MKNDDTSTALLKLLGFIMAIPILIFVYAFTVSKLWVWLIMPVFTAAPPLSLAQAYGLTSFIGYVRHKPNAHKDDRPTRSFASIFFESLFGAGLVLLVGYVLKTWFL